MKHFIPLILILLLFASACKNEPHFITDKTYRTEVKKLFEQRKAEFAGSRTELFGIFDQPEIPNEQKEALEFLYAYMSLNDLADYDGDFFYKQTKTAFEARNFFAWGKTVPEELFRHFVLPVRVNNENLDTARQVIFRELKDRVAGKTMYQAALEVNRWCHEKVTYRGSCSRTSAPLATMLSGYGRCGEESTFTTAALRAVGIPARQCYTPRWAHTDDNHAWVEVWADGKWYFLGACEPDTELNKAWFTAPAKRAMMVHTNVFGKYMGNESKTEFPLYTKINTLENYTEVKKLGVTVLDSNNTPVEGAKVHFGLYNYAEYYPIYEQTTNAAGKAEIISGMGDLVVWASKNDWFDYKQVSLANTSEVTITLTKQPGLEFTDELDLTAPPAQAIEADKNADDLNSKLLQHEDSIRNAYLATFISEKEAKEFALNLKLNVDSTVNFLLKSEGNYQEISKFITENASNPLCLPLLSTLTDKDLRDTPANILQAHLTNTKLQNLPFSVFVEGVLSPRILTELIRGWRPFLQENLKQTFAEDVTAEHIKQWIIDNIKLASEEQNYSRCRISPVGVFKIKQADKLSRAVFFVAVCRSFGIPAKMDAATLEIKVFKNEWQTFNLEPEMPVKPAGTLVLNFDSKENTPQYLSHYSLAKYENGAFVQLDYEADPRVAKFPVELSLEEGYYRLTSGRRLENGSVLARNEYFNIKNNSKLIKQLVIRNERTEKMVFGKITPTDLQAKWFNANGMAILFLNPGNEPTKHVLSELPNFITEFENWKGSFVFIIPDEFIKTDLTKLKWFAKLPKNSVIVKENGNKIHSLLLKSANVKFTGEYPTVFIVNSANEIVFYSEGYRIGLADAILKNITN